MVVFTGDGGGILCEWLLGYVHSSGSEAIQPGARRNIRMYSSRQGLEVHCRTGESAVCQ